MDSHPLVSIIVPTKNSQKFLSICLQSLKNQTFPDLEIIIVDNYSTDDTLNIAKKFTSKIYQHGPERSAQVNFGVLKSRGKYVYKVDSDFQLENTVVEECLEKINTGFDAVVVHNSPDTSVSWISKIRKFEVDMYKYDTTFSSARFIKKSVFKKIGGFSVGITAGEDYDFQNKLNTAGFKTGFIVAEATHLGEPKSLRLHLLKYYQYGKDFVHYSINNPHQTQHQLGTYRFRLYLRHWRSFIRHPLLGLGFTVYNLLKYTFSAAGFIKANPSLAYTHIKRSLGLPDSSSVN